MRVSRLSRRRAGGGATEAVTGRGHGTRRDGGWVKRFLSMILLLGASGYVGQAFERELKLRGWKYRALSRREVDYTRFETLRKFLAETRPTFLVNAAGYTGKPNVDACETARADTLQGNTLFPVTLAHACAVANVPWGHVSSGCIYAGAWVTENGARREEKDLTRPEVRRLVETSPVRWLDLWRRMSRTFRSAVRRAVSTAARRLWRRRHWLERVRPMCGGCASRSTRSTTRAIT